MSMPFLTQPGIMLDIETLGRRPGCVVTSIGAVKFTFDDGITGRFKVNINVEKSVAIGLKLEKDTVDWWSSQPKSARDLWMKTPEPIDPHDAVSLFIDWCGFSKKRYVYCQGTAFDQPILQALFEKVGKEKPWTYRQEMCSRTIFNMVGYSNADARQEESDYHDSLADAESQANALIKLFS